MTKARSQRWRQAVVWLHILTSVGWMAEALALLVMLAVTNTSDDAAVRTGAMSVALVLDSRLLGPLANASAFTGIMLAASTQWGLFRQWWVLVKFAITLVQLYAGIFILSNALHATADAARAGEAQPASWPQLVGVVLMASAIAFQAWLSEAKPWPRTPWTHGGGRRAPKLPTAPTWVFVVTVFVPLADIALGLVVGHPMPALSLLVLVIWLPWRAVRLGTGRRRAAAVVG